MNNKPKRIPIDISQDISDNLEFIQEKKGMTTRSQAIRKSIQIYKALLEFIGDDNSVFIEDKYGTKIKILDI